MTTASEDRVLILVRHSEAESGGNPDAERELTEGGWEDARDAGRWLHEYGVGVDEVLCSTAARARAAFWSCLRARSSAGLVSMRGVRASLASRPTFARPVAAHSLKRRARSTSASRWAS